MKKAGWIFNLNNENSLKHYLSNGVYATKIKPPKNDSWNTAYLGTLADYASMKAGQNVYFFLKRKIYGIGELTPLLMNKIEDCSFDNFFNASLPKTSISNPSENDVLYFEDIWTQQVDKNDKRCFQQRWVCIFKPSPHFYHGIDMDDLLKSDNTFREFRSLRSFSGLSFIKLSPCENNLFLDFFNKEIPQLSGIQDNHKNCHNNLALKFKTDDHSLGIPKLVDAYHSKKKNITAEMLVETYILYGLTRNISSVTDIFGSWDYFSHQVTASPFKPVEYMNTIDICGFRGKGGFREADEYLLIELKAVTADNNTVQQIEKYIEWFAYEYSVTRDKIKSFIVAPDFKDTISCPLDIKKIKYGKHKSNNQEVSFQES